jgi:hypothetical protein
MVGMNCGSRWTRTALVLLAVLLLVGPAGCGSDDDSGDGPPDSCTMSGTITDLGGQDVYAGGTYVLYIDEDSDPGNGHVESFTGIFPTGPFTYSFDISGVTPGTYYVYMTVDLGQGAFNIGYYGAEPMPWDVPAAANADVQCGCVLDFDVYD